MDRDITLIKEDHTPERIRRDLSDRVEYRIKQEARNMFEYQRTLEKNVGKVLRVRCGQPSSHNIWSPEVSYLLGRIGDPIVDDDGKICSEGDVFLLNYDFYQGGVKKGYLQEIEKGHIEKRYVSGPFPISIWDLIHPRTFDYNFRHQSTTIPIREVEILDSDIIMKHVESL